MPLMRTLGALGEKAFAGAKQVLADTSQSLQSVVQELCDTLNTKNSSAAAELRSKAESASQSVNQIAKNAKQKITDHAKAAGDRAGDITGWAQPKLDRMVTSTQNDIRAVGARIGKAVDKAGDAISSGFRAARSTAEGVLKNVDNMRKMIYLNVGCWQNGLTDFALVCGPIVALCSWRGGVDATDPKQEAQARKMSETSLNEIKTFLKSAPGGSRPTVFSYECSLKPDMTAGKMYLFIGDLHLHLFKESTCDNFLDSGFKSLEKDLTALINHAAGRGLGTKQIWQVGDCFEVWEAQGIMDFACDQYVAAIVEPKKITPRFQRDISEACQKHRLPANVELGERGLRRTFLDTATPLAAVEILRAAGYELRHNPRIEQDPIFKSNKLNLAHAGDVEEAIKKLYQLPWGKFSTIRGNHDNSIPNDFLDKKYGQGASTGLDSRSREYVPERMGAVECIGLEHGDALDDFNNRKTYDKGTHGFSVCRANLLSSEITGKSTPDTGTITRMTMAATHARFLDLKYSLRNVVKGPQLSLIVFGHTHERVLVNGETLSDAGAQLVFQRAASPSLAAAGRFVPGELFKKAIDVQQAL